MPSTMARARFSGVALARVRPVKVPAAPAVEIRQQGQAAGSQRAGKGETIQPGQVDAEHGGAGGHHAGGIEGAQQRQVAALGVGEALQGSGRISHRMIVPSEDRAARAQRDDDVARCQPEAKRRTHVVAGPRPDDHARGGAPGHGIGGEDLRHVDGATHGEFHDVGPIVLRMRGPVARAGGVTSIGGPPLEGAGLLEQTPGEPVVRQHACLGAAQVVRLVASQPAQLGRGDRRDRHDADLVGPGLRASELLDQIGGGPGRAGVVPQQRGPDDVVVSVQGDHAVLLAADGDCLDAIEDPARTRGAPGIPPCPRIDLGPIGMRRPSGSEHRAGLRIADDDLAGLGRTVDARDQRTAHHTLLIDGVLAIVGTSTRPCATGWAGPVASRQARPVCGGTGRRLPRGSVFEGFERRSRPRLVQ